MTKAKKTVHIFLSEHCRALQWVAENIANPVRCSNGLRFAPIFLKPARVVLLMLLASLIASASSAAAGSGRVPPFTAKGVVSMEVFQHPGAAAILKTEEDVFFTYSNGLWQVELKGRPGGFHTTMPLPKDVSAGSEAESIINCRNISDGVRYVSTTRSVQNIAAVSNVWRYAFVEPTPFPPPDMANVFICWLALSPSPKLPLIDGNKMRRLLSADFLKDPKNQGEYALRYTSPDNIFLSELCITNDGTVLLSNATLKKQLPPFDKGYLEFEYKVLETTNWNGVAFPLRSTLQRYYPLPNATNRNDLFATVVTRLDINSIHAGIESPYVDLTGSKLIARDNRLPHLPELPPIKYTVTNDQWVAATNAALAKFAANYNTVMKASIRDTSGTTTHKRLAVIILMVILTLGPVAALILSKRTKNSDKNKTS